ncbi:MAG: hypothetical protein JO264_07285 [Acidisphaera sp.]|nr:hypothetical protein [Acidisphaera sp.]
MVTLLGGCSSLPPSINPVAWWHGLQGGVIAEQRPPPPNADAPYPSLGSVPPKPAPPDAAAHQSIANALVADRANAQYDAQTHPLPTPPARAATPALFGGAAPARAADPNAASASLAASSAPARPPPAPTPPSRAPRTAVQQSDLPAPVPASLQAGQPAPDAPLPTIPDAPPAAPQIAGLPIAGTTPSPPPVAPPVPPASPAPLAGAAAAPVPVAFPAGSAVLPPGADAPLRQLAARRGSHAVDVIGYGEATTTEPQVQSAAIDLGLARARAIVAVLTAAGVPVASVHMAAEAAGRGGAARLVE